MYSDLMRRRRAVLAVGASVFVLAAYSEARAQSAEPATVGEIVVTAQRHAESANRVPMAIQAFTGEQLQQLRVTSTKDLSTVAPSFSVSQGYQGVPIYTLRGIGFNTINLSATSTVGTYWDEVAYPYPFMNSGPLFDLARVEVLKGPQGTLYGRNTTAGLLDFITNKPSKEFASQITAEVGNYSTRNFEGFVTGPLADRVQARIAFRTEDSNEGWQKSNSRPDEQLGENHRYGVRASIAAQPTDELTIDASLSAWWNKSDTVAAQVIGFTPSTDAAQGGAFSAFNTPGLSNYIATHWPTKASQADWEPAAQRQADVGTGLGIHDPLKEDDRFYAGKLRIGWDINDNVRVVSLTAYNDLERNAAFDWSGAPYELLVQKVHGTIKSISEDLHFEGDTKFGHWLVGGYYGHDKLVDGDRTLLGQNANVTGIRLLTAFGGGPIPPGGLIGSPINPGYTLTDVMQAFRTFSDIGNLTTDTWSLFASADWKLTDTLGLTTGIRYSSDRQAFDGCSFNFNDNLGPTVNLFNRFLFGAVYGGGAPPAVVPNGGCTTFDPATASFGPVHSVLKEDNVAWRVVLDWTPIPGQLYYLSVSKGAKAGDTPINAANISTSDAPAKQELLTAYEVGTKSSLFDRRVQLNASFYYYDYEDKQLAGFFADPIYTALGRLVNVPQSKAYGVDGDVTWRVTPELTAMASVNYLQTRIDKYVGVNGGGQLQDFAGGVFPLSPVWQSSFTVMYNRPLNDKLGLQAAINYHYQSRSHVDFGAEPLYEIRPYGLLNASIGLHDAADKWEVSVWGRNVTNVYYWGGVAPNANTVVRFAGMPATYGATFTLKY